MCGLADVQSSLSDAVTYQQRTQERVNNNPVDRFLPYLINSDKVRGPVGLG